MEIGNLFRELEVLKKAVEYPNLSGAAGAIGLSQPQLSRVIKKLEDILKITLLDRTSKRKSAWTPLARQLTGAVSKVEHSFQLEIQSIIGTLEIKALRIGTLEGLVERAARASVHLFEKASLDRIHLDVYDLNELEGRFMRDDLDIIISSREPGVRKYVHSATIGHQKMDIVGNSLVEVLSEFEFLNLSGKALKQSKKRLVSNSLAARKYWIEKNFGKGKLPFDKTKATGEAIPVHLVAQDTLSERLWNICETLARAEQKLS